MTDPITSEKQKNNYSLKVDYMPDQAAVQCLTIRNQGLNWHRLAALVWMLGVDYEPMKIIVIDERKES
jgi:hypothetical protein